MAKRKKSFDEAGNEIPLDALPELPEFETDDELNAGIAEMAKLQAKRKEIEASEEQLESQIMRSIWFRGLTDYTIPGVVKAVVRNRVTRTLHATKLVALGVDPDKIAQATTETTSEPWVQLYNQAKG